MAYLGLDTIIGLLFQQHPSRKLSGKIAVSFRLRRSTTHYSFSDVAGAKAPVELGLFHGLRGWHTRKYRFNC
jgi:hypothetical protein